MRVFYKVGRYWLRLDLRPYDDQVSRHYVVWCSIPRRMLAPACYRLHIPSLACDKCSNLYSKSHVQCNNQKYIPDLLTQGEYAVGITEAHDVHFGQAAPLHNTHLHVSTA
jgi:hypothetical protein